MRWQYVAIKRRVVEKEERERETHRMTMRLLPADSWGSKQQTLGFSWFQPPQCHSGMKTSESLRYPLSQLCHLERAPFHLQVLLVSPGDLKHFDSHLEVSGKMDGL